MDNYEGKLVKGYWGGGSPSVGVLYIEESFSRGKMYVVN